MGTPYDKKPKGEKVNDISSLCGDFLLEAFLNRNDNFNPTDSESCETYDIIKTEIVKRLRFYDDVLSVVNRTV